MQTLFGRYAKHLRVSPIQAGASELNSARVPSGRLRACAWIGESAVHAALGKRREATIGHT